MVGQWASMIRDCQGQIRSRECVKPGSVADSIDKNAPVIETEGKFVQAHTLVNPTSKILEPRHRLSAVYNYNSRNRNYSK